MFKNTPNPDCFFEIFQVRVKKDVDARAFFIRKPQRYGNWLCYGFKNNEPRKIIREASRPSRSPCQWSFTSKRTSCFCVHTRTLKAHEFLFFLVKAESTLLDTSALMIDRGG
jgi:cytochrome c oxidase assembly protein Cox11